MSLTEKKALQNIAFHNFVGKDQYPALVSSVDAGLISLSNENKTPVVPGKLLGYMAAGKPVIAALNRESDGHNIISEAGCGYSVVHGDMTKFTSAMRKLHAQRRSTGMGLNGRKYLLENYTKEICVTKYEDIFQQLNC